MVMGGDYRGALSEAESAIRSHRGRAEDLYYLKGLSELKLGRYADARESFGQALKRYPNPKKAFDARLGMGDSYMLEGSLNDAVGAYLGIARDFPADANIVLVYSRLASCYKALGVNDKAEHYRQMSQGLPPVTAGAMAQDRPVRPGPAGPQAPVTTNVTTKSHRPSPAVSAEPEPVDLIMSTGREISVQVGSFRNRKNAEKLARKLASAGFDSRVEIPVKEHDNIYRVKVGRVSSKAQARELASKLKGAGYSTKICDGEVCQ
jgi:cell division septation protein DedD